MILRTESGKCLRGCCNHSVGQLAVVAWGSPRVPAKQGPSLYSSAIRSKRCEVEFELYARCFPVYFTIFGFWSTGNALSHIHDLLIGWITVAESISDARE